MLFVAGLWPFNFNEKNNAVVSPTGGLEIARHGTAYTALPAGKLQDLKQFAIHIDLTTSSDGLGSLEKIFGYFISQEAENFFLAQWKDGMELRVRTERNAGGMIFGTDGVLKKEERAACLIIYDGLKMHIYKNGKLIRRDNRGPLSFSNWSREYPLVLGTDATGRAQWRGCIYQIALWDRSLSPEAVADYMRQAFEGYRLQATGDRREKAADNRPLVHYILKPENTYETEFRGKKALGVRDLGKGGPADLVIPEHFAPYERVYLGWDPDWMKRSSDWLDVAVNILGFVPFGVLLMLALSKEGTRDEGVGTSAAQRQERKSQQPTANSRQQQATRQENPSVSPMDRFAAVTSDQWPVTSEGKEINQVSNSSMALMVVLAVVAGFVVSFAIEYLQAYLPSRDSSMRDLVTNTLGTAMGAVIATQLLRNRFALVTGDQ